MEDLDAILFEYILPTDGIWSVYGIDDDRPMAAWSGPHYARANEQHALAQSRVAAAEWRLNDVRTRGANSAVIANSERELAAAQAELGGWVAQIGRLEMVRE
jgi:hypothetical protein